MLPGLDMPPKTGPRVSWWESLRPNALSLGPPKEPLIIEGLPAPRSRRRSVVLGCVAALVLVTGAGVATWQARRPHLHAKHTKAVRDVVSGRAGLRKTATGATERWSTAALTITIDPTLAAATPLAKDAIINAFGAWLPSGAYLPSVTFDASSTPGSAAQDGVNRLLLGPIDIPGQEQDLAVTISYADPDTGALVEADTIFNNRYDWTSMAAGAAGGCGGRYDLENVATHEAGHFFGLGEDYSDVATTMYVSSSPCQTSKRSITALDVTSIAGLYAEPLPAAPASGSCGARIGTGGNPGGAVFVVAGLVVLGIRRRGEVGARGL